MSVHQRFVRRLLRYISLFVAVLTLLGLTTTVLQVNAQPDNYQGQLARNQTTIVVRNATTIPVVSVDRLPPEARSTLNLIRRGGPYPYAKDGTVFGNRERRLPQAKRGYYREYTVKTTGARDRGARRIITGQGGEIYYTGDHYATFVRVQ
ncbi:MAG: ribonuclease domain-containing protein [Leptolyngbya sp. BL-A-14]